MKIEKIDPVYKTTFNSNQNPNKNNNQSKQSKKGKTTVKQAVTVEISSEGRKKLEDSYER